MRGRVVSAKLAKTVTVLVEREKKHPLYKKSFVRTKRYLVDDLIGAKEGDIVEIVKIRPISKNKHHQVIKVLGRSLKEIAEEQIVRKLEPFAKFLQIAGQSEKLLIRGCPERVNFLKS